MPESSKLQDFDLLEGAAREFAESRGFGPLSTDSMQWTLIHHCCANSEHHRGMHEVLKSLLAVCPIEIVDQKTGSGTPSGWSALSLLCNARDAANTRIGMVRMMLERRADTEASNPQGSTPLIHACASGFWSVVRLLLDAKADHNATKKGGRNALDVTPKEQTQAPLGSIGFLVTMSPATSQV